MAFTKIVFSIIFFLSALQHIFNLLTCFLHLWYINYLPTFTLQQTHDIFNNYYRCQITISIILLLLFEPAFTNGVGWRRGKGIQKNGMMG